MATELDALVDDVRLDSETDSLLADEVIDAVGQVRELFGGREGQQGKKEVKKEEEKVEQVNSGERKRLTKEKIEVKREEKVEIKSRETSKDMKKKEVECAQILYEKAKKDKNDIYCRRCAT